MVQGPLRVNIEFLVKIAEQVLRYINVRDFHLVEHSMGGLTALELAAAHPGRVRGFVNMKGNTILKKKKI